MFVRQGIFNACLKNLTPRISHEQSSIIRVKFFSRNFLSSIFCYLRQQFKHKVFVRKGEFYISHINNLTKSI